MNPDNLNIFKNKKIIVGITGSIAAYKAAGLCSKLVKAGAEVFPVLTPNAEHFIAPLTFSSITGKKAITCQFQNEEKIAHISLSHAADLIVIAPATANTISKIANGICDNFLTTAVISANCPVCIAPAMNQSMYLNDAVKENILKLKNTGKFFIVEPETGKLACGEEGAGRLAEDNVIINRLSELIEFKRDFSGKKILITAGGTREFIDTVRFISNISSGKMGLSMAEEAFFRGAQEVVLISASSGQVPPSGINFVFAENSEKMLSEVNKFLEGTHIIVMSAAVSDIVPERKYDYKLKKNDDIISRLKFRENINILGTISEKKKKNQFLVGFSAEHGENVENTIGKMKNRNIDMMVLNDISRSDIGFESDYNEVTVITSDEEQIKFEKNTKRLIARKIWDIIKEKTKQINW
jgi:phosphopantothenoylcysteine decarboxylase/phosphopantothenate--cysteine ligase